MMDYRKSGEVPQLLRNFITYHESIRNHSKKTCDEYFLDLRHFFRFLKVHRGDMPKDTPIDDISIADVDKAFLQKVTMNEVYAFLTYLSRERLTQPNSKHSDVGLTAASRARKVSCLRSFFKYLTVKVHVLDENPIAELDSPRPQRALPKFLTLEQSQTLLKSVEGKQKARDYAILAIFLVCGLRISEVQGLNVNDWNGEQLRVLGKGNKERFVYLNDFAGEALQVYISERDKIPNIVDPRALFLSSRGQRMHVQTLHKMVKKHLAAIGMSDYSAHKLRHSAATMMLAGGANIRVVQEFLGHENLNTTEIYTHVANQDMRQAMDAHPLGDV